MRTMNIPAGRYTACVIHDGGIEDQAVVFAGPYGTRQVYEHIPAGFLSTPGELFDRVSKMFGEQAGTLILPRVPYNMPEGRTHNELQHVAAMVAEASAHGWRLSGGKPAVDPPARSAACVGATHRWGDPGCTCPPLPPAEHEHPLTGWYSFLHDVGRQYLHVGILPMIDQSKTPLFDVRHDSPARIAGQLVAYERFVGAPYRATPGVAGCAAVRNKWARASRTPFARARAKTGEHPEPKWRVPVPDGVPLAHGDIVWKRAPLPAEDEQSKHIYDMRNMYLSAMQVAGLPYGPIRHRIGIDFAPGVAGVWRIEADTIDPIFCTGEILPPLISMRMVEDDGSISITTPLLAELARRKAFGAKGFRVIEAHVAEETRAWLRPIAEDWRNALYREHPPIPHGPACTDDKCGPSCLRFALSATYKQTNGMIAKDGGSIHNPMARAMVVDTGRRNIWVKLWDAFMLTGIAPVAVKTDEVAYYCDRDSFWLGEKLGVGDAPGKFRHVRTELVPMGATA